MIKKEVALLSTLMVELIIIMLVLINSISPQLTIYVIKEQKNQVQFYFYDEETNCSLNGYVFSGSKLIGETHGGFFNLTYENYVDNFDTKENISLFGVLGSCFNNYLFFDKYWKAFEIDNRYFSGGSVFNFKTKINYNTPTRRELIGFVQPYKVKSELENINIKRKDVLKDLSEINNYLNKKTEYVKDWNFTNKTNYWQTPTETMELGRGDCEDFSTTLLSLFMAYNDSLNCHNVIFSSHVTTFCKISNYYIYYDQGRTELRKEVESEDFASTIEKLKELKKEYFEHYGLNESNTSAHYAFNNEQFVEFESEDSFINWQYNVRKTKSDPLQKLKQEVVEIKEKYPPRELELGTTKPSIQEMPTLKGFLTENSLILALLGIIFISLIIILIINLRKG